MADIISNNGVISAQNTVPAGVAPANSAVELEVAGVASADVQTVGVYTGALSLQATVDGQTWVTIGGTPFLNQNTGGYLATITSALQSILSIDVASYTKIRITALAAVTGSVTVNIKGTKADGMIALAAPLPAGAALIGGVNVAQINGVTPLMNAGVVGTGSPRVVLTNDNSSTVTALPATPTGHNLTAAATTNATSVKATAANLYGFVLTNYSAAAKFYKVYNKASAPVVGTDIPVMTIDVGANTARQMEFSTAGLRLATGYAFAMTGAQPDTDTTALAAGDLKVIGSYA